MTFKEVASMIKGIGYPYAYYQFDENTAQKPPFICFFYEGDNDALADNSNYQKIETLILELYSDDKDYEAEAAIEAALKQHDLVWSREETVIDSEKLYMVIYRTNVIITEV